MSAPSHEPPEEPPGPDWDSFETWKGDEPAADRWWGRAFHWLMVAVVLALVFAVAGGLAFLLPYGSQGRSLVKDESGVAAGWRFAIGGAVGVASVLRLYFRKRG